MNDHQIKTDGHGSVGVSALSERAQTRGSGPRTSSNLTLIFRARVDAIEFVRAGEAEGYTFAGKDLLYS
jgi:hypothetical protein